MRLVRFDDPAEGIALELHPLLSVVSGLPVASRQRLLDALAAIPRGQDPGVAGQLEVHGVLLDLDQGTLELLELDEDLDVVLRAEDLPRGAHTEPEPEIPDPPDRSEELAAASARVREIADRRAELETVRSQALARLADLAAQRAELSRRLDQARQGLDDYAAAGLKIAEDEFEALQRRARDAAIAEHEAARRHIEEQLERLVAEVDDLRRRMRGPSAVEVAAVRAALDGLLAALDPTMVPSPEAVKLADELSSVARQLAEADPDGPEGDDPSSGLLEELTARRDAAYDAMVAAEAALRSPEVDESLVAELESIHDEIFELDGRVSKLSAARVRRRLAELRDREAGLLDQLGYDSWASYVMGVSTPAAESERRERYEVARATYEFAEEELARAADAAGSRTRGASRALQTRRAVLLDEAANLLGRPVEIEEAIEELRELKVPAARGDVERAAARLSSALAVAGADPAPDQGPDELVATAQRWLEGATPDTDSLEAVRADLDAEISQLAAELDALPTPESLAAAALAEDPQLADARAKVEECRRRVERHRAALARVGELRTAEDEVRAAEAEVERLLAETETSLAELTAAEAAAAREFAELEAQVAGERDEVERRRWEAKQAAAGAEAEEASLDAIEWYVLARLAQQRAVSFVGSAPFAIDDAFADWSAADLVGILARLARMSEVIQVIFLTDDVEVAAWARSLGPDRAAVIDLARAF
jgi:chromosome segregation protein